MKCSFEKFNHESSLRNHQLVRSSRKRARSASVRHTCAKSSPRVPTFAHLLHLISNRTLLRCSNRVELVSIVNKHFAYGFADALERCFCYQFAVEARACAHTHIPFQATFPQFFVRTRLLNIDQTFSIGSSSSAAERRDDVDCLGDASLNRSLSNGATLIDPPF